MDIKVYSTHFELDNGITTTLKYCLILLSIFTCLCITRHLLIRLFLEKEAKTEMSLVFIHI